MGGLCTLPLMRFFLSLEENVLLRGTNGGQKERKSANIEVKNQKTAKMDEIHVT